MKANKGLILRYSKFSSTFSPQVAAERVILHADFTVAVRSQILLLSVWLLGQEFWLDGMQKKFRSRNSSVGIATGYGLDGRVHFPSGTRDFSLLHSVQTGSEAHPFSYPIKIGSPFLRG
jgi:hypothetical protein